MRSPDEEVRRELQRIADANGGRLEPRLVVAAARHPQSVLHDHFPWDDAIAAEAYREVVARRLIRGVHVIVRTESTTHLRVPLYVRDPQVAADEQGYRSVIALRSERDLAREVLVDEFGRVASALQRARNFAVLFALEDEIDGMLFSVDRLRGQLPEARA